MQIPRAWTKERRPLDGEPPFVDVLCVLPPGGAPLLGTWDHPGRCDAEPGCMENPPLIQVLSINNCDFKLPG